MESILLTAISKIPIRNDNVMEPKTFSYKGATTQKCISQLEPVFDILAQQNDRIIHIIALCTKETLEDKDNPLNLSAIEFTFERFENRGYKRLPSTFLDIKPDQSYTFQKENQKVIFTIFDTTEDGYIDCLKKSTNKIKRMYKVMSNKDTYRLWINANGAFRDMYLLIVAIISLMKVDHIIPEKILLPIIGKDNDHNTIIDADENFNVFDFVSGINDFIAFGRGNMLKEYYRNKKPNKLTNKLIDDINDTYLGLQFNNYDYFENTIKILQKDIKEAQISKNIDTTLLTFLPIIKEDFGKDLLNHPNPILMIQRCIDKKMYQHAATLIESNIDLLFNSLYKHDAKTITKNYSNMKQNLFEKKYLFDSSHPNINKVETATQAIDDFAKYYKKHLSNGFYSDNNNDFEKDLKDYQQYLAFKHSIYFFIPKFPYNTSIHKKAALSISLYQAIKQMRHQLNHAHGENVDRENLIMSMNLYINFLSDIISYEKASNPLCVVNTSNIKAENWSHDALEQIPANSYIIDLIDNLRNTNVDNSIIQMITSRKPDIIIVGNNSYKKTILEHLNKDDKKLKNIKEIWLINKNNHGIIEFSKKTALRNKQKPKKRPQNSSYQCIDNDLAKKLKEQLFGN